MNNDSSNYNEIIDDILDCDFMIVRILLAFALLFLVLSEYSTGLKPVASIDS